MSDLQQDPLEQQLSDTRRTIASDGYPMSIGELTNLYRDGELIIRPEFQRFYRWTETQKSRLIESLLLGIPIPSIFVAQSQDGTWELVDGLQRVSTILELQGELRDEQGKLRPPLQLQGTALIPALDGRYWSNENAELSLSDAHRLDIKRTKLDLKIIKRESSPQAKYDLFQRLNSYGSVATAQEMRSAMIVAVSPDFHKWLEQLAAHPSFVECTDLSEKQLQERFDLELVLRFLALHNMPEQQITTSNLRDFPQVLDHISAELAYKNPKGDARLRQIFTETFDHILEHGAGDSLRKWDDAKQSFRRPFLITAFEIFALGVGHQLANGRRPRTDLRDAAVAFWSSEDMQTGFATGKSTEARLSQYVPLGRVLTQADDS
ncbi:MAG: DUF262 domain-containing protein [Thermoplasmatota archaeon]